MCDSRFCRLFYLFLFWHKNFKRIGCAQKPVYFRLIVSKYHLIKAVVRRCSSKQLILKTSVLESLFNKVPLKSFIKKRLQQRYFPVNIAKSLTLSWRRPLSYRNQSIDLRNKIIGTNFSTILSCRHLRNRLSFLDDIRKPSIIIIFWVIFYWLLDILIFIYQRENAY